MAGELVPVVLWPRFSAFTGGANFKPLAMDVTEFQNLILSAWRSPMASGATFKLFFEESTDQVTWTVCTGANPLGETLAADEETQFTVALKRRWFRLRSELGGTVLEGTVPVVTCWAAGFLESRES